MFRSMSQFLGCLRISGKWSKSLFVALCPVLGISLNVQVLDQQGCRFISVAQFLPSPVSNPAAAAVRNGRLGGVDMELPAAAEMSMSDMTEASGSRVSKQWRQNKRII